VQDAPKARVDKNPKDMWWPVQGSYNVASTSHSPKRKAQDMAQAVKGVNIQHKDQLTTFVPWQTISFSALLAEEFEESPYHQSRLQNWQQSCTPLSKHLSESGSRFLCT